MASSNSDHTMHGPSSEAILSAVLRFSRALFVDRSEQESAEEFLHVLREVFPGRHFLLRLVDLRRDGKVRIYGQGPIRTGLEGARLTLKQSAVDKTQLKEAVMESAGLRLDPRWDSPFNGLATGFAMPLTIAGELFGVLDVGYPLGQEVIEADEQLLMPLVNQLASAVRNDRLYNEARTLRNYQARLIEHASAFILGVDDNWRIRVCNRALCNLLGNSSSELVGKDLRDFFPVVDRHHLIQIFDEAMRGQDSALGESQIVSADGRHVPVVWRVAPIRSRGKLEAVVAVGQDQSVLSELQKQLVQAEKMSTLGQIAAGVVHELNNPLTAIGVYSEFLLKRAEERVGDGNRDELLKLRQIRDGAERIKLFTRDLIQYARPSAGVPERLSINQVINQSLSFCQHLFSDSGVELVRDLDTNIPDACAVPGQLEQVIVNLVTNAVHACGDSGSVRVRSYAKDGKVMFSVRDEGPGISIEDQRRIFEPFFTTKSDGKGTGLGLSIVRNILEENAGEVRLHSEVDEGAEFECVVPAYTAGE